MSLTLGGGTLASSPAGTLLLDGRATVPGHAIYLHPLDRRIRGRLAGETVVDTRRARLLHEPGRLPQWYLPADDVRTDLLVPSSRVTTDPQKGTRSYWSLRVGDRLVEDAVWSYPEPPEPLKELAGTLAIDFAALDAWFEEDDQLVGHPRDPYHRVDTRRTSRQVRVTCRGEPVAESARAVALFETGLPVRFYLPPGDVRFAALAGSVKTTYCPYKGVAHYYDVRTARGVVRDAAWTYREPLGEALLVAGYLSFLGPDVDITVDGEPYARNEPA